MIIQSINILIILIYYKIDMLFIILIFKEKHYVVYKSKDTTQPNKYYKTINYITKHNSSPS